MKLALLNKQEFVMLLQKSLLPALSVALMLGFSAQPADAAANKHHKSHHTQSQAKQSKLHPSCKKYLDRRAAWYKHKGNKAELRENVKARKAFRQLPYKEQRIQCQAAYEAFDDFDHGKFRR